MVFSPRLHWPLPPTRSASWFNSFNGLINNIDSAVYALRENDGVVISGGGSFLFDPSTDTLTWSAALQLTAAFTGFFWTIPASTLTVPDGAFISIQLSHSPTEHQTVQFDVSLKIPNNDLVLFVAHRQGDRIYWRTGVILQAGVAVELFITGPVAPVTVEDPAWGIEGVAPVVEYKLNGDLNSTGGILPSLTRTGVPLWSEHFSTRGSFFKYNGTYLDATHPSFLITGDMTVAVAVRLSYFEVTANYWLAGVAGNLSSESADENCLGALIFGPLGINRGISYFSESDSGTDNELVTQTQLYPGQPYLVAFSRSGTTVSLYVNDVLLTSGTVPLPTDGTNARFYVNGGPLANTAPGLVLGAWIYNVALTQAQIRSLWQRRFPSNFGT